jgi:hypothetical protein
MRTLFLSLFVLLLAGYTSVGQNFRIKESNKTLYLLDSTGANTLDTLRSYNFFIPKKNGMWVFYIMHARQEGRCRTEYLFVNNLDCSEGKFRIAEQNKITVKNDKCGNIIEKEGYYCFYFDEWSIINSRISIVFSDSEDMGAKRIIDIHKSFKFDYFKTHLCRELNKYPKFSECYSCF